MADMGFLPEITLHPWWALPKGGQRCSSRPLDRSASTRSCKRTSPDPSLPLHWTMRLPQSRTMDHHILLIDRMHKKLIHGGGR